MRLVSLVRDPSITSEPASETARSAAPASTADARAAVLLPQGPVPLERLPQLDGAPWPTTLQELVCGGRTHELRDWLRRRAGDLDALEPLADPWRPAALYRQPRKIIGVGLNYEAHAGDLGERRPEEPASFMKPATTIVGPGDPIELPRQSERTTGEAELGVIVGRRARDVSEEEVPAVVAGVTTIVDMTAEDILQRNPRFLTRAKSFDTFFSFGPELVTLDEIDDLGALRVTTLINGEVHRENQVRNMMFGPWFLVSFFSRVMTLEPGDVISTGTPGAVVLRDGDVVGCRIGGVGELANPVRDPKA